jgi:hypothetical protein
MISLFWDVMCLTLLVAYDVEGQAVCPTFCQAIQEAFFDLFT